ncbi:MAG: DUF1905 domain-containing protein [Bacteroidetes bacterium]|nr:DUF1905 domain-containing protein [Bacteroidota bacterium]
MYEFKTTLLKFGKKGEKTGWTYVSIPLDVANIINPSIRKSYRVKGFIDSLKIKLVAILPDGDGSFIMPINAEMRKRIRKQQGAVVTLKLSLDTDPLPQSTDLLDCLLEAPVALNNFKKLTLGHQNYFSKWIESAKTSHTKADRITKTIKGLELGFNYGEMIRHFKKNS